MIDERFRKYEPFFGKWKISKELGKGSFGQVFEIYWDDGLGSRTTSALKIIHIPSEEQLQYQVETQPNMEAVREFFLRQVDRVKDEIRILQKCKGHSNIVSYEDHMIVENVGEKKIGWDILIRMELLSPLQQFFSKHKATQYDVVQMWRDIANALIYCEEQNIIHRDIKPANILRAANGNYKLSDFGVAKRLEDAAGDASTKVGTERYMAPEVYKRQKYDKRSDYYSLGCVIYFYLNKKRHVFLPPYPQEVTAEDNERANDRRLDKGEKIPKIPGVSKEINEILQKSMDYNPKKRYKSAKDLYNAVQHILDTQGNELKKRVLDEKSIDSEPKSKSTKGKTASQVSKSVSSPNKGRTKQILAGVGVTAALALGIGWIIIGLQNQNISYLQVSQEAEENIGGEHQAGDKTESGNSADRIAGVESESQIEHTSEAEKMSEPEFASETKKASELESTSETEKASEPESTSETEKASEPESTSETEKASKLESEREREKMSEPESTSETGKASESESESEPESTSETEKASESESESETEKVSESESESETETEKPLPTTPAIGDLERPADGDKISGDLKIKGWILTNDSVGDIEVYGDFVSEKEVIQSYAFAPEVSGMNTLSKRQEKYKDEIAAVKGYEIKGSQSIEGIPDGDYELKLRMVDQTSGKEEILDTVKVSVSSQTSGKSGNVMEFLGVEEEEKELDTHYIYEDKGYAIGLDVGEDHPSVTGNANQILLTGWINAPEGTSLGMYLDLDSQIYTEDTIAEQGGSFTVTRAPRNLESMDANLIGSSVQNMEEAGYIINLNLPFLAEGTHTASITLNVGIPGGESELVDLAPVTIEIDPSVVSKEDAVDEIVKTWEEEFPEPDTEAVGENVEGQQTENNETEKQNTGE